MVGQQSGPVSDSAQRTITALLILTVAILLARVCYNQERMIRDRQDRVIIESSFPTIERAEFTIHRREDEGAKAFGVRTAIEVIDFKQGFEEVK